MLGCIGWIILFLVGISMLIAIFSIGIGFFAILSPIILILGGIGWWYFTNKKDNPKWLKISKISTILGGVGALILVVSMIFGEPTTNNTTNVATEQTAAPQNEVVEETEQVEQPQEETPEETEVEEEPEPEPEEEQEPEEPEVPREHENALSTAENYINMMGFSQQGLREQLEFEGYPTEAINYAIENIEVDYNEEALETALNYQETMPMSDEGLKEQLIFEGFTEEQAQYAIDNLD